MSLEDALRLKTHTDDFMEWMVKQLDAGESILPESL